MKAETVQRKLNELLGIQDKIEAIEVAKQAEHAKLVAVEEHEIPFFRAKQGLLYFLKAPELFTIRTCANCGEAYAVSRKHVAYCGYPCMSEGIRKWGLRWDKGNNLEALALDPEVFDGNEPLWVNNLPRLQELLSALTLTLENLETSSELTLLPIEVSKPVASTTSPESTDPSEILKQMQSSLSARSTTSSGKKPGKRSLNLKG